MTSKFLSLKEGHSLSHYVMNDWKMINYNHCMGIKYMYIYKIRNHSNMYHMFLCKTNDSRILSE